MKKSERHGNLVLEKLLPAPGLIVTTVLAICLFASKFDHWASSLGFAVWVNQNRSTVGLIVQVISQFLGLLHVFALATVINLSSRSFMSQNPFSLDRVKLFSALAGRTVDLSLPLISAILAILFTTICLLPGAFWAGAITPVNALKPSTRPMQLPAWANTTILEANYHSQFRDIYDRNTADGLFTYRPDFDLQGSILGAAAQASNQTGGINSHAKLDKTGYIFAARSFGVGASVGLADHDFPNTTKSYNYTELALQSHTSCIYNDTSDLSLGDDLLPEGGGWLYTLYDIKGSLPVSGQSMHVETTAFAFNKGGIVSLFTATDGTNSTVGILAGDGGNSSNYYAPLNNIQCSITFTPTLFSLHVDRLNRTISVDPISSNNSDVTTPPYAQLLTNRTLGAISTMSASLTTTYVSLLGQTLMYNIANTAARSPLPSSNPDSASNKNSSALLGVSDAIDSFIDNILLAYSTAQLMITRDSTSTPVHTRDAAIVFGTPVYIYLIFIANLIVLLIYLAEALRTRMWGHLPRFDYMDVKSVIVGASRGGRMGVRAGTGARSERGTLADQVEALHARNGSSWRAEGTDRLAGNVQARLEVDPDGGAAIVAADRYGGGSSAIDEPDVYGSSSRRRMSSSAEEGTKGAAATEILLRDMGEDSRSDVRRP